MPETHKFGEMKSIIDGQTNLSVVLAGVKEDIIEHRKLNFTQDLSTEFKEMLQNTVSPILDKLINGENHLIDYEPGYKKDKHEIEHVSIENEEYATVKRHIDAIPNLTNVRNLELNDEEYIKKLSYFVIQLQSQDGKTVKLFRKYMHKKELTKKKKIKAIYRGGTYDSFQEPVLLFDEKIDCVEYEGNLYIIDTQQFHYIFQFYEKLAEKAQEIITHVIERIPIDNVEELRTVCSGHPTMLAKIHSISRKDYLEEVTINEIQETIQEFQLDVKVSNGELVFEKEKRWEILKLLDEHYLGSLMTGRLYDANSKRTHSF